MCRHFAKDFSFINPYPIQVRGQVSFKKRGTDVMQEETHKAIWNFDARTPDGKEILFRDIDHATVQIISKSMK